MFKHPSAYLVLSSLYNFCISVLTINIWTDDWWNKSLRNCYVNLKKLSKFVVLFSFSMTFSIWSNYFEKVSSFSPLLLYDLFLILSYIFLSVKEWNGLILFLLSKLSSILQKEAVYI